MSWLVNQFQTVWVVAFVILFQPEIRRLLTSLGQNRIIRRIFQIEQVYIEDENEHQLAVYKVPYGAKLFCDTDDKVIKGKKKDVERDFTSFFYVLISLS